MAVIEEVVRGTSLEQVLTVLGDPVRSSRILAGGTDLLLRYQNEPDQNVTVVDVTSVRDLTGILEVGDGLRIGAAVRLADLMTSRLIRERFPVLVEGAGSVAGPQIRNLATLGGNVCNASPSADTIAPLLVLDTQAIIRSAEGQRKVPLVEFFVGPGQTVLAPGELLEALWVPWPVPGCVASYTKLSPRKAMDLAIVGVAVALGRYDGALQTRIGLAAVAPTPLRATEAEAHVDAAGLVDSLVANEAGRLSAVAASPIDDVRASAGYRRKMVERLVARMLLTAFNDLEATQ
jgi:CO/xanthine dehydrogenase FAD-binding subunit